ncbi:MAG: hypothetical protein K6A30_02565 [Lachnospiraceae bacterium]|nr:hypothetical protein [Lachnospiraceae bacterium]
MYGLKEMLLKEKLYLENIVAKMDKEEKIAPEGTLRISVDHGKVRYYHCIEDKYGDYIPRENKQLPRDLAQKTYNSSVVKAAQRRLKLIARFLSGYSDDEVDRLFENLHSERKVLITPVELPYSQLEAQWYATPYIRKGFSEDSPVILTEKGERVRSKSEKILADYFERNNILYKYEKPLNLEGYGVVYPDFTFFSEKYRKEIFWEHEGMMDHMDYAGRAIKKINNYQKNGIYPGERLILTFETSQEPLNSKIVKKLVDKYLR